MVVVVGLGTSSHLVVVVVGFGTSSHLLVVVVVVGLGTSSHLLVVVVVVGAGTSFHVVSSVVVEGAGTTSQEVVVSGAGFSVVVGTAADSQSLPLGKTAAVAVVASTAAMRPAFMLTMGLGC